MTAPATGVPRRWAGRWALGETAATNVTILALGTLTGIVTARALGPHGRGAYALAIGVAGIAAIVTGLGLQQAFAYTVSRARSDTAHAISLSVWAGLLGGCAAVALGYPVAGLVINDRETLLAVRLALLSVPLSLVAGNLIGVLQGLRWARPFNAMRIATPLAFMIFLVGGVAVRIDYSASDVIVVYLAAAASAVVAAVVAIRSEIRGLRPPPASFTRPTLRYGAVVNIGSIAWQANRYFSVVVLAALATLSQVGYYSVAMAYALPAGVVALALALHTLPDIAGAGSTAAQAALARRRLRTATVATLPLVLAGVAAAPLLIPLAFGARFDQSIDAARILVLAEAVLGITHVLSEVSRGFGRPGLPAIASVVGTAGALGSLPLVVPRYGIEGAAVATACVYCLMLAIVYIGLLPQLRVRS